MKEIPLLKMGTPLLLLLVVSISAAPRPEAPVANYIANFYDPHPIATYGAHPFHINAQSAETAPQHQADEGHVGNSRRGSGSVEQDSYHGSSEYTHEDNVRHRKSRPYGHPKKHHPRLHSGEHDAQDSPSRSYSSSSSSKPRGYNPYRSSYDYSPSQGYAPEGWFNTMQGGYDDYGYNYDRAGSNSPPYRGPPPSAMYNTPYGARAPSSTEDDGSLRPPPSSYSFGAGAPEFVSYTEEHEPKNAFSSVKGGRRPTSNGYGQDPYFTFGPKKKIPSKHFYSGGLSDHSKPASSGRYRLSSNKYSGPKSSSRPSPPPSSYYDKGNSPTTSFVPLSRAAYGSHSAIPEHDTTPNLKQYYRTRPGGWSRSPATIARSIPSYKYKYSTIPYHPNATISRPELENGPNNKDDDGMEDDIQEVYEEWEGGNRRGGDILNDDVDEQYSEDKSSRDQDKQRHRSSYYPRSKKHRRHTKRHNQQPQTQTQAHRSHNRTTPRPRKSPFEDLLRRLTRKSHN